MSKETAWQPPVTKDEVLHIRVDSPMHDALRAKAEAYGAGVTTIVRMILREQLIKEKLIK